MKIRKRYIKYKKTIVIEYYLDKEYKQYFLKDGTYLPIKNKAGHISGKFSNLIIDDSYTKICEFKINFSMIYGLQYNGEIVENRSENKIYLCS